MRPWWSVPFNQVEPKWGKRGTGSGKEVFRFVRLQGTVPEGQLKIKKKIGAVSSEPWKCLLDVY